VSPPHNPGFTNTWFLRCQDLIEKYDPDLVYFDDPELPLGHAGLEINAYFYNLNMQRRGGKLEAVVFGKEFKPEHAGATALDIERGRAQAYKSARTVVQMLIDIVSKNGNLCLSIPLKGDETFDSEERKVLDGIPILGACKW
jgi:alpha-L-fucosidase